MDGHETQGYTAIEFFSTGIYSLLARLRAYVGYTGRRVVGRGRCAIPGCVLRASLHLTCRRDSATTLLVLRLLPGQRHWPCSDRGDRSGAELKSGVLVRGG
eukprot:scaffold103568_cov57-Phaeocystis_antarctica.AAC.1